MIERSYIDTRYQPTLEDLKRHLRITSGDLDETLQPYLLAAINAAEHSIGSVIAVSEMTDQRRFANTVALEGPVLQIKSVKVDGTEVDKAAWSLEGRDLQVSEQVTGARIEIVYEAGMVQVPFDMKAAILMIATKLFNNPSDSVEQLPSAAKNLLRPYRSWGIHDGE